MRVYKMEVMVIDTEGLGVGEIKSLIEDNSCDGLVVSPVVRSLEVREIADMPGNHPHEIQKYVDSVWQGLFLNSNPSSATRLIDLDELLNGNPTWEEVVEFWKSGDFCGELCLVEAIEKYLLTVDQRGKMFDANLSIEKMLNRRYGGDLEGLVYDIYGEWNDKLGFKAFGD